MPLLNGHDPHALDAAARTLADGGLVAIPTETVYGLAARADRPEAVAAIFALKGRPSDHPLIVHVADAQAAAAFAHPTPVGEALMANCWPGPVSLVLPRRPGMADAAAAHQPTVALRCPSHPVAQALLRRCLALGVPGLAVPSANRFGRTSPTSAAHVRDEFGETLAVLDGGPCEAGIESAIVDASGAHPRLLRPGTVPRDRLESLLAQPLPTGGSDAPRVSGSLASHYAPLAAVHLVPPEELQAWVSDQTRHRPAAAIALWSVEAPAVQGILWRRMPDDATLAARQLFERLRTWDAEGASVIGVQRPPAEPAWEGVLDRLQRASAPRA